MLGWPIGRMEPAGRHCLASLYCGGRDTRLHVQGERQLGVQYGLRFLSWARCFGPTVRLARVGRAVRGGRSIGRRELACKGGELSGARPLLSLFTRPSMRPPRPRSASPTADIALPTAYATQDPIIATDYS